MPRYAVLQNYGSGTYGPWEIGTQVELDEGEAVWVNRDSPGTLARVKPGQQLEMGQPVPASVLLDEDDEGEAPAALEPEPKAAAKVEAEEGVASGAASTSDEGAPVADKPRGRGRASSAKK